jgi:hypothetical protein
MSSLDLRNPGNRHDSFEEKSDDFDNLGTEEDVYGLCESPPPPPPSPPLSPPPPPPMFEDDEEELSGFQLWCDADDTDNDAGKHHVEDFIQEQVSSRGWMDGLPTTNPHVLYALCNTQENPWSAHKMACFKSPEQLSACLENVYTTTANISAQTAFSPRNNDVIVCGMNRTGQTPVLQILAALKTGKIVPKERLLLEIEWIESANPLPFGAVNHVSVHHTLITAQC